MTTVEHPIAPLRSTCKYLANGCAPALFSTITTARKAEELVNLLDCLINIRCFVKHLKLYPPRMDDDILAQVLAEVVDRCSNLRRLTIYLNTRYKSDSIRIFAALKALPALAEIRFKETAGFWCEAVKAGVAAQTIFKPLLQIHGNTLSSLSILGGGMLGHAGLESLTRDVPRLVNLTLYKVLHAELRNLLAESGPWACAGHLRNLKFIRCRGLHANIFTQKLASGVFGHPKRVYLAMCGDVSDHRGPSEAIEWTIPALDTLKLDRFAPWEMEHLQLIHAKKVFLSRMWRQGPLGTYKTIIQHIADKRAFPEVMEVHVATNWGDEDFRELQRVCSARGVNMVMRDWRK